MIIKMEILQPLVLVCILPITLCELIEAQCQSEIGISAELMTLGL